MRSRARQRMGGEQVQRGGGAGSREELLGSWFGAEQVNREQASAAVQGKGEQLRRTSRCEGRAGARGEQVRGASRCEGRASAE